jgi:hypothetical protein
MEILYTLLLGMAFALQTPTKAQDNYTLSRQELQKSFERAIQTAKHRYILDQPHNPPSPNKIATLQDLQPYLRFEGQSVETLAEVEEKIGKKILSLGTYGRVNPPDGTSPQWEETPPRSQAPRPINTRKEPTEEDLTKFLEEAQALVQEGTKESITKLIGKIRQMPTSRETMGTIYQLYSFPNPEIAEWIAQSLGEFPDDPKTFDHINLLTMVAGKHLNPKSVNQIAAASQSAPNPFQRAVIEQILSHTTNPDTLPALMETVRKGPIQKNGEEAIGYYAAKGIANQNTPEGNRFLAGEIQRQTNPLDKAYLIDASEQ